MKREAFLRAGFTSLVSFVSLPWLMPCSGPGSISESSGLPVSPDRDLLYLPLKPGAALSVRQNQSIPLRLRISDEEAKQLDPVSRKPWKRAVLCQSQVVVIEGEDVRVSEDGGQDRPTTLAFASTTSSMAKITIATSAGTLFATAERIHFRGASSEIVLEGTPFVQFGRQQVRAAGSKARMKLDYTRLAVSVSGRAVETKF